MKDIKKQTYLATLWNKFPKSKFFSLFLLIIIQSTFVLQSQDLRDLEHTLKFADYLFKTQQFVLASEEFERAVYYEPSNKNAKLLLLKSYRFADKYEIATNRFETLFNDSLFNIDKEFAEEYIKNLFLRKQFSEAFEYLQKNQSLPFSDKETYQLGSLLLQKNWDKSFNYALKHPVTNDKKNVELHTLAFTSKQIKYKKPFVAGLLSTVAPGTGKIYTKNWKDGIISMVFVGVNTWQAFRGFNKYGVDSAYGWVFAGFAGSFYIGNIFGSAKSAKKYNKKLDDEIYHKAWHTMVDDM